MLTFFRRKTEPTPAGDWWTNTFAPEAHAAIESVLQSMGMMSAENLLDPRT
jgi:hypothetical protein